MCTALLFRPGGSYFGRNLDVDRNYGEQLIIIPRNFTLNFRKLPSIKTHYAIIGTGIIRDGFPLFFDACNEKGVAIAGLNFPESAAYMPIAPEKDNIAPFELIPYLLAKSGSLSQAESSLENANIVNIPFSNALPLSPLHWLIADKNHSITAEPLCDGLHIYQNPTDLLTNEPPFPMQLNNLKNYMHLSVHAPKNNLSESLHLKPYSYGMGAMGLPGDLSSSSRFVKAFFTKEKSICDNDEYSEVSQFFHILDSVYQQKGCVCTDGKHYEFTAYSSCCNLSTCTWYYTTYKNSGVTALHLFSENLNDTKPIIYPLLDNFSLKNQN